MYKEILEAIGLSKSEIAVYLSLLKLGSSTTGPVIKQAGIAAGKAYLVLDRLAAKGLVTHAIKSGVKYYQAKDPDRLLDYLRERQEDLKQKEAKLNAVIPELKAEYEEKKYLPQAEIFEGPQGFKTFYLWLVKELKKGDQVDILGVPREASKFEAFLLDINKMRIAKGIKMRIIYNYDARVIGKKRAEMKLTEVKYLGENLDTPAWVDIFGDYVATIHVRTHPVVFLIHDKEVADSYRKYFDILWKQAKP